VIAQKDQFPQRKRKSQGHWSLWYAIPKVDDSDIEDDGDDDDDADGSIRYFLLIMTLLILTISLCKIPVFLAFIVMDYVIFMQ
jgi:hypothetical protein